MKLVGRFYSRGLWGRTPKWVIFWKCSDIIVLRYWGFSMLLLTVQLSNKIFYAFHSVHSVCEMCMWRYTQVDWHYKSHWFGHERPKYCARQLYEPWVNIIYHVLRFFIKVSITEIHLDLIKYILYSCDLISERLSCFQGFYVVWKNSWSSPSLDEEQPLGAWRTQITFHLSYYHIVPWYNYVITQIPGPRHCVFIPNHAILGLNI